MNKLNVILQNLIWFVIGKLYNGSLYVIIINNTWSPNNKCHINHYHSNADCYTRECIY